MFDCSMKDHALSFLVLMPLAARISSDPNPKTRSLAEALQALPATSIGDGSVLLTVSAKQVLTCSVLASQHPTPFFRNADS